MSPFTATARDDRSPVARVRYVSDGAIYVKVADVSHDALPSVTGYPISAARGDRRLEPSGESGLVTSV